ncbi:MAG: response regulator [SAR324 cluster bacterium]|nr:response regulator [SAR324 cluster bacterium]
MRSLGEEKGSSFCARIPVAEALAITGREELDQGLDHEFAPNCQIHFAENGKAGVDKLLELHEKGQPPSLVLMDMQMPVMDGREATRQIRSHQEFREVPIAAVSADAYSEKKTEAFAMGVQDYLTKPIEKEKLLYILKKYLPSRIENPIPNGSRVRK